MSRSRARRSRPHLFTDAKTELARRAQERTGERPRRSKMLRTKRLCNASAGASANQQWSYPYDRRKNLHLPKLRGRTKTHLLQQKAEALLRLPECGRGVRKIFRREEWGAGDAGEKIGARPRGCRASIAARPCTKSRGCGARRFLFLFEVPGVQGDRGSDARRRLAPACPNDSEHGPMRRRIGKNGPFLSCRRYPKCDATQELARAKNPRQPNPKPTKRRHHP